MESNLVEEITKEGDKAMKSISGATCGHPLPYLRGYYRLYKQTKDENIKQEIIGKMKGIIDRNRKQFMMPKGLDKEFIGIFQLLGYNIELEEEEIAKLPDLPV